jgi:hypothetical protein
MRERGREHGQHGRARQAPDPGNTQRHDVRSRDANLNFTCTHVAVHPVFPSIARPLRLS